MCGIAGFYHPRGTWDEATLQQMTNCLAHRGPDAEGFFIDRAAGVGLGHRRLSILDLSEQANQPMEDSTGRYVAVFNGEVFNYRELAPQLAVQLRTSSDTEVVLEGFAQQGPDFIRQANGMFALAIYDRQAQRLWLFRDRMGVKPLLYAWDGTRLLFASELKALRTVLGYMPLNPTAVHQYLHLGYIPAPDTIYQGVFKFPQGHYAQLDTQGLLFTPYWQLQDQFTPIALTDEASATTQLAELVTSAVGYQLIADVPVGSFLSGGVDSSLVTAVAQRLSSQPIQTFSIGFANARHDERSYARAVAKALGTTHTEVLLTEQDALNRIEALTELYDEPYADSSAIPTWLVAEVARRQVKVVLSGDGGDELFLGYGMYNWAQRLAHPAVWALRHPLRAALKQSGKASHQKAARLLGYPQGQRERHLFSQEQLFFTQAETTELLLLAPPVAAGYAPPNTARKLSPAEAQAFFDLQYYLPDDLLTKVDRASMAESLEVRVPLLDYRLVSFALNLHQHLKLRRGTAKYLLKQVLYDYLPATLFDRPKWGFSIPMAEWLQKDLHYLLTTYLSKQAVESAGLVHYPAVERWKKAFARHPTQHYNQVWALIQLHRWALAKPGGNTTGTLISGQLPAQAVPGD